MVLLANRVKANRERGKIASTAAGDEKRRTRSKMSAASSLVSIPKFPVETWLAASSPTTEPAPREQRRGEPRLYEYAEPTRIFRNRAGLAPCPVPTTCCGWPLPQFGVPHSVHSSREQIASIEFQNSVVIPE